MAANPSFDIVSKVDRQEVDNALRQAEKELATRFDFRGTGAEISWSGEEAISSRPRPRSGCGPRWRSSRRSWSSGTSR